MTEDLVVKCKLLVQNRDILKNEFEWASTNMIVLCAYYFAERNKKVDAVRMKECKQAIKRNSGVFTKVKGDDVYPLAAMLALEENAHKALQKRIKVYQQLCNTYQPSVWMAMVSFLLASQAEKKGYSIDELVERAERIEENVKKDKPMQEVERSFWLLLSLSKKEEGRLLEEMKSCYSMLEGRNLKEEPRVLLSIILALGEDEPEANIDKLKAAMDTLKQKQQKLGNGIEVAALGLVAISKWDVASCIDKVIKVNSYLKTQKGFDSLQLAARERLMYSILFVTAEDKNRISEQFVLAALFYSVVELTVLE